MTGLELKQLKVSKLHQRLSDRVFAVPKLQREFVWNGPRAAALLDSIYRGMPIGSLLVWETRSTHYDLLRQSLHILPPFDTSSSYGWFLIDGQQRLSVLYEAVAGEKKRNSSGQEIDFGRLCFDLQPDASADSVSCFAYRKQVFKRFIPVQDILAPNWQRRLRAYPQYIIRRLKDCREKIREYKVPVVVVRSDDIEEVREVFIRINAQGMKISAADRAFAKASKIDLRQLAHELRAGVNRDFADIDFNTILQGFSFVTDEREVDVGQRALESNIAWWERIIERDKGERAFLDRWKRFRTAFGKSVDYLCANFCVLDNRFLPSENMLATLSVFFFHHPAAPSTKQRGQIRRWFWATGVCQRYSGRGYRQNLMSDIRFFSRLARGGARFQFDDHTDRSEVSRSEYGQHSSLNAAYYCLLVAKNPRFLENGEPIRFDQDKCRANRSDRHHIFPRQLLASSGMPRRDYNSLCNICLIVAEENQRIGMRSPATYLSEYRRKKHFKRAMNSHLIPYDVTSGLWTRGARKAYTQFRKRRLALVCSEFEKLAEIKLFRKA